MQSRVLAVATVAMVSCQSSPPAAVATSHAPASSATSADASAPSLDAATARPDAAAKGTFFEGTTWGMAEATLRARYGPELVKGGLPRFPGPGLMIFHRTIDGVRVEVAFHFERGGLSMIELVSLGSDCSMDYVTLRDDLTRTVGRPTKTSFDHAAWQLPGTKIVAACEGHALVVFTPLE